MSSQTFSPERDTWSSRCPGTRALPWGLGADLPCIPLLQTSCPYSGPGREGGSEDRHESERNGEMMKELMMKRKEKNGEQRITFEKMRDK